MFYRTKVIADESFTLRE